MSDANRQPVSAIDSSYVVIARAQSAALFPFGFPGLTLTGVPNGTRRVDVAINSWMATNDAGIALPYGLRAEVRGNESSFEQAVERFASTAAFLLDVLAFSVNMPVFPLFLHLAYDNTSGRNERKFLQAQVPMPEFATPRHRVVQIDSLAALLWAVRDQTGEDERRLCTAISQYNQAMRHWQEGQEIVAAASLWICVEAITKVIEQRKYKDSHATNSDALAKYLGLDDVRKIDGHLRLTEIFENDRACYRGAKDMSNEWEHAYRSFRDVYEKAEGIRDSTARYVRSAILRLLGVSNEVHKTLTSDPYRQPAAWPMHRRILGMLKGDTDALAAADQPHPYLKWTTWVTSVEMDADGAFRYRTEQRIAPIVGEAVTFEPTGIRYE